MQLEHKDALPTRTQIQESRAVAVTVRKLDGYPREFQSDARISNTEPECTATFSNGWRKKRQVTQLRREEVTGERRNRYSSQGEVSGRDGSWCQRSEWSSRSWMWLHFQLLTFSSALDAKLTSTPWDDVFVGWSFPKGHWDMAQGYHRLTHCHSLPWKASLSLRPECVLLLQCSHLPIHSARTLKVYLLYTGKWNSSRLHWWYRWYLITTLQRGHIGWHYSFKMVWPGQSGVLSWRWRQYTFGGFNKALTLESF